MCYFMLYPFMTLNDNTEIVHSEVLFQDNREQVQVRIEKPVPDGFHSATCWLPDYRWEKIVGFSEEDIHYFQELLESVAHVIIRLAREKEPSVYDNVPEIGFGIAHKYANPALIPHEEEAYKEAIIQKYKKL